MGNARYEKYKETYARWRENNRDYMKNYYQENKEKHYQQTLKGQDKMLFGGNRAFILSRDDYRCVECGMTNDEHISLFNRQLTIHHIDGNGLKSKDKNNNVDNLETLCLKCHGRRHGRQDWKKNKNKKRILK